MLVRRFRLFLFYISRVAACYEVGQIAVIADHAEMSCIAHTLCCCLYYNVEITVSDGLLIVGHIPVIASQADMLRIAVAHTRCGVNGINIRMPIEFCIVGYHLVVTGLAGICSVPAL